MLSLRRLKGFYQLRRCLSSKASQMEPREEHFEPSWNPPKSVQRGEDEEQIQSLVQDFFLGIFDTAVLTFPEVIETKARQDWLYSTLKPIQTFFDEKVDSRTIDSEAIISTEVMKGLKGLGLFGQEVPAIYGGLGLNTTESARIAEITGTDTSVGRTLTVHQSLGIKGLLLFGTETQKKKYLSKLASGEQIAAFCLAEETSGSDIVSMKTTANLSTDGSAWTISGTKSMVTNGDIADIFIVIARTSSDKVSSTSAKRLTAFIVERTAGAVETGEVDRNLGVHGAKTCNIIFDKAPVSADNIIGAVGDGYKVASHILNCGRLSSACLASGLLKKMIGKATQRTINHQQFGKSISDFPLIKEKLARMTISAYTIESLIYMTAGMIDMKTYADTSVETAILKIVSSEGCWKGVNECLQIMGGKGYLAGSECDISLRDSRAWLLADQTNEILRLYIASCGIQHAGQFLYSKLKKTRNPLSFPGFSLRKGLERIRQKQNTLKLVLRLREYLHPSLLESADRLESSLQRCKYATEHVLLSDGAEAVHKQLDLQRLAEIAIDMYTMTAVLSRSSRAYCVGLKNAEDEVTIAEIICKEAAERIQARTQEIDDGEYLKFDNPLIRIADSTITNKGYACAHPLDRTFW